MVLKLFLLWNGKEHFLAQIALEAIYLYIFCCIFNLSLYLFPLVFGKIPWLYLLQNHLRTSGLNPSLIMKSFEKTVKVALLSAVEANLDPHQLAYRFGQGCWLCTPHDSDMEGAKALICLYLYLDLHFSRYIGEYPQHWSWPDMLADGFLNWKVSTIKVNSVLSDALFFLPSTNECQSQYAGCHIICFADESTIGSFLHIQN